MQNNDTARWMVIRLIDDTHFEVWSGELEAATTEAKENGGYLAYRVGPSNRERASLESLSPRERQVLVGIALGHPNRDQAKTFGVSTKTIDTHRLNMMRKIGAKSNADVARFAIRCGVVEP